MRTLYPILLVLALGTAALVWGMSGMGAIYGESDPVNVQSGEVVEQEANESVVGNDNESFEADTSRGDDNIVGIIVSGISYVIGFVSMVALLPWELQALGFPAFFAIPIGGLVQILVGVGVIQFATGRVWR